MSHEWLRRARAVAGSMLLVGALGSVAAAPVRAAETVWYAFMTGDQEVPGPGDDDGDGVARVVLDAGDGQPGSAQVCVRWDVLGIDPATAAHIHLGAEGVAGGVVVPLPTPDADGLGEDCTTGLEPAVVQAIIDDPTGHYVNVHNDAFQGGAVRGQLDVYTITNVVVAKLVCPAGTTSADPSYCTPAALTGTVGDPPPGLIVDPPILEFDMEVTLEDGFGTLFLEDAELDGGFVCGATTCSGSRSYRFIDVLVGETILTQETFPDGYEFGWATIESTTEGGDAPEASLVDSSIAFDTTGFDDEDGFLIRFYDVLATAPTAPPPPTATIPPTSTEPVVSTSTSGWLTALVAALAGVGLAGVVAHRRRRRA